MTYDNDLVRPEIAYGGQGPTILIVSWTLFGVSTLLIFLWICYRKRTASEVGCAVYLAICAWMSAVAAHIFGTVAVYYGLGNDIFVSLEAGTDRRFLLFTWLSIWTFQLAIPLGKVAVSSFLLSLHPITQTNRRLFIQFIGISNLVVYVPELFLIFLQCDPPDALWDLSRQQQCNFDLSIYYAYFLGGWAAISDLVMAIFPTVLLWPVQIDCQTKFWLSCLLGLGALASVTAVLRTIHTTAVKATDNSYELADVFIYAAVEMWIVLIALSIPPNVALFKSLRAKLTFAFESLSKLRIILKSKSSEAQQEEFSKGSQYPRDSRTILNLDENISSNSSRDDPPALSREETLTAADDLPAPIAFAGKLPTNSSGLGNVVIRTDIDIYRSA